MSVEALRRRLVQTAVGYRRAGWQDSEDVAHDVLLRALSGNGLDFPVGYWVTAVRNQVITVYRRDHGRMRYLGEHEDFEEPHGLDGPDLRRLIQVQTILGADKYQWLLAYHQRPRQRDGPPLCDKVKASRMRRKVRENV